MGSVPKGLHAFFRITPEANDLCVFAVNRGDTKKRLDPHVNHPKFQVIFNRLKKYTTVPLRECAEYIFSGITPKAGGDAYTENDDGVLFVKSGCLSNDGLLTVDTTSKIKPAIHNGLMKSSKLKKNDVLIAIVGATIGKIGLFNLDCEANINQAIAAVRLKNTILPEFLVAYMLSPFGQAYLDYLKRPVARANINLQEIGEISVPLLSTKQQKDFINAFYSARNLKEKKLKEAEEVRASIVSEMQYNLSIAFPSTKHELYYFLTLETIKSNITKRIDPKCYDVKFQNIRNAIDGSVYPSYKLRDLILDITGGDWGYDPEAEKDNCTKCLVLRATEISNKDNIEIREDKIQYRQIEKKKLTAMNVGIGDIIVEKSGGSVDQPVGRVIYVDQLTYNGYPIVYSNFLTKLKIKKDLVNPYYLFEYLRFVYKIGLTEVMQNQTNGIRNLIVDEFLEQTIIVPPNHYEIGCKMKKKRLLAYELEKQAETEWQSAKEQFEKELLQ